MKQNFSFLLGHERMRSCLWLLFLFLSMTNGRLIAANPVLVSDDILTFTGGEKDPVEDIYIIDMGEYDNAKTYEVKVARPKGATANYEVSVEYKIVGGSLQNWSINRSETLVFAAGETEKVIEIPMTIEGWDPYVPTSTGFETAYIFFNYASRTKTEYPLIQMNFQTHGTPSAKGSDLSLYDWNSDEAAIGQYVFMTQTYSSTAGSQFVALSSDTKYEMSVLLDKSPGNLRQFSLTPREVGATTTKASYLYKLTEDAVVPDYYGGGRGAVYINRYKLNNIKVYGQDEAIDIPANPMYNSVQLNVTNHPNFYFPPRFGEVTSNKQLYKSGEIGQLKIPFLNAEIFQAALDLDASSLMNNIMVTLDGGKTIISSEQMSYNPVTKEITVSFSAPTVDGLSQAIYAEVLYDKLDPYYDPEYPEYGKNRRIYIYGANTSFSVMSDVAETVYTENVEIIGSKLVFIDEHSDYLQAKATMAYKVYPENCTFITGTWSSSDPTVATIDSKGVLALLKAGKTTITFTSSEVAYRESVSMPENNGVLIKSVELYVEDNAPKIIYYSYPEPYTDPKYTMTFHHNLGADWTVVDDASIRFVHKDSLKYADIYRTFQIDDTNGSPFRDQKEILYDIPFGKDFPKIPSWKDESGETTRVARAYLNFSVRHISGEVIPMSSLYEVLIASPWVDVKIGEDQNLVFPYIKGEPVSVDFDLFKLSRDGAFTAEYIIEKTDGTPVLKKEFHFESPMPDWLTTEFDGDLFKKGKLKASFIPTEPTGTGLYDADKYVVKVLVKNYLGLIQNQFYTTCRVSIIPTKIECLPELKYQKQNVGYVPVSDNWEPDKEMKDVVEGIKAGTYNSYTAHQFFTDWDGTIRLMQFYPEGWGKMQITVQNDKGEVVNEYLTSDIEFYGSLFFPTDGKEYTVKLTWPQIKNDQVSRVFKYKHVDVRRQIYTYTISSRDYVPSKTLHVTYTTLDGAKVSKTVKAFSEPTQKWMNRYYFSFCEPRGIEGLMYLSYDGEDDQLIGNVKNGYFNHPITQIDNPIVEYNRWAEKSFVTQAIISWTPKPEPFKDAGFQRLKLVDSQGKAIIKDVKIKYLYADPNTMELMTDKPKGTVTTLDLVNNTYLLEAPNDKNAKLLFEVAAVGYQPQLLDYKYDRGNSRVVRMKSPSEPGYFDVSFIEDDLKTPENLTYLPTSGVQMYSSEKNPKLSLTIPFLKTYANKDGSNFILSGRNALSSLNPELYKVLSYDYFDSSYAQVTYSLKNFLAKEKSTQTNITSAEHFISLNLPSLKNYELDSERQKQEAKEALSRATVAPIEVSSITKQVDMKKTAGAFNQFNIAVPSGLPFTIEVERDDDEWLMRGVFSQNFVPGGKFMDALGSAQDFESVFNECRDQVHKIGKKDLTSRYDKHDNYFGKSPFVGFKAFASAKIAPNPETSIYELSFNDAGVALEVSGEVTHKTDCFIARFGVGLGGSLRSTTRLANPSAADKEKAINDVKVDLIIDTEASLEAWAYMDVGFDIFLIGARAGIRGSAWADYHSRMVVKPYMPKSYDFQCGHKMNLGVNLQMYAWAKFLGIKIWDKQYNILNIDKTYYWPNNSSNPLKESQTIKSITRSGLLSDTYTKSRFSADNLLLRDLDVSAEPLYLNDGSLVYNNLKNVDNQDDNRIQLYGNGGNVFDINPAAQTSAYTFHSSSAGSHKLVAYEELSGAYGTPDISDIQEFMTTHAHKSEMSVSVFDPNSSQWQSTRLTNDETADMRPQTAITSTGNAVALWTKGEVVFRDNMPVSEDDSADGFTDGEDNPKLKVIPESTNLKYYTNGDLMLARYIGGAWLEPKSVASLDSIAEFNDYVVAISKDNNVLIAATRKPSDYSESKDGDIILISVNSANVIKVIETGKKGAFPKFTQVNNNFLLSFMTNRADVNQGTGETNLVQDVYLMSLDDFGNSTGLIDGYANVDKGIIEYKIASKENAKTINDLLFAWKGSLVKHSDDETVVETGLYAAKLGKLTDVGFYASTPKLVFQEPTGYEIASFDVFMDNDKMKAAILIADENGSGAVISEEEFDFQNKISSKSEFYSLSKVEANRELPVEFTIQNDGYLPIKWIDVKFGDKMRRTSASVALPGTQMSAVGLYDIPDNVSEPNAAYEITATFEDGSTAKLDGSIKLSAVNMKVKLVSTDTGEERTTIMVNVANQSSLPLNDQYEFTLGLYEDVLGEKVFEGTTPKVIPLSELYADNSNQNTVVTFEIENVKDVKPAYALINMKKKSMLRAGTSASVDNQDPNGNNAMIMLFPYHRTYWQGTIDSDWNNVDNWSSGLPDATLDVVIQSGTPHYPTLKGGEVCRNIYFKAGSNVTRQDYLTYEKAFVQYDFQGSGSRGRWQLLTIPLKEAYAGDFHYGGYPEAELRELDTYIHTNGLGTPVLVRDPGLQTSLTPGIAYAYKLGENDGTDNRGLQLSGGKLVIPFFLDESEVEPDVHYQHSFMSQPNGDVLGSSTFFNYRATNGTPAYELISNDYYTVSRTKSAYKLVDNTVNVPLGFSANRLLSGIGNPFMGAISFDALYAANASKIRNTYQVLSGKGDFEAIKGYNTIAGHFGVVDGNDLTDLILPTQGFVVEKNSGADENSSLSFNVVQTANDQSQGRSGVKENRLSIVADNGLAQSRAVIAQNNGGSATFGNSDSRKLIMSTNSVPEVYTLKPMGENLVALGANVINTDDIELPLGIKTMSENNLSLTFTGMDTYEAKIYLGDRSAGKVFDLTNLDTYTYSIGSGALSSVDNRFYILIKPTTYTGIIESDGAGLNIYGAKKFIYATSGASNPIQEVFVYNTQGVLVKHESVNTSLYKSSAELDNGAYIVKLKTEKGTFSGKVVIAGSY